MTDRPESQRSDWTEQDLLTIGEALPRLDEAIAAVEAEARASTDEITRQLLGDRLKSMRAARKHFTGDPANG